MIIYVMQEQLPEVSSLYNYEQIMLVFGFVILAGIVLAGKKMDKSLTLMAEEEIELSKASVSHAKEGTH